MQIYNQVNFMDDIAIINLYFERNELAIHETDSKYGKLCFTIANNILSNHEDSEECVNDTYINTWNSIPPTRPCNFRAFLCRITRNLSIKKLRFTLTAKRNKNLVVSLSELSDNDLKTSYTPEHEYEFTGKLISDFLRNESEDVRNIFIRKYYFMDSVDDIAKNYGFSSRQSKSALFHCRNKLKAYLKGEGVDI